MPTRRISIFVAVGVLIMATLLCGACVVLAFLVSPQTSGSALPTLISTADLATAPILESDSDVTATGISAQLSQCASQMARYQETMDYYMVGYTSWLEQAGYALQRGDPPPSSLAEEHSVFLEPLDRMVPLTSRHPICVEMADAHNRLELGMYLMQSTFEEASSSDWESAEELMDSSLTLIGSYIDTYNEAKEEIGPFLP